MADDLDLSESLAVLHGLVRPEDSQHPAEPASSATGVRPDSTQLVQELSEALAARAVIDQAKGMLMTRLAYNADEAFALLQQVSQDSHEKMIVVAQRMLESALRARQN